MEIIFKIKSLFISPMNLLKFSLITIGVLLTAFPETSGNGSIAHARENGKQPITVKSTNGLYIKFSLIHGETSKDNHEYVYKCMISGSRAVYSGPYGTCVRGQCRHRETVFILTTEQAEKLNGFIKSKGLFRNFRESRPIKNIGRWVRASLSITMEGRTREKRTIRQKSVTLPEIS